MINQNSPGPVLDGMRPRHLGFLVFLSLATTAGCTAPDALPTACRSNDDCTSGRVCHVGSCGPAVGFAEAGSDLGSGSPDAAKGPDQAMPPPGPDDDRDASALDPDTRSALTWQDGGDGAPNPDPLPRACYWGDKPAQAVTSQEMLKTWLIGRWRTCSGFQFGEAKASDAIEFGADGSLAFYRWEGGGLVRAMGFRSEATWALDELNHLRVRYTFKEGGGGTFTAAFQQDRHRLLVQMDGGSATTYMLDTQWLCENAGAAVTFTSQDDWKAFLPRRWMNCGGGQPAHFGGSSIEFTGDGHWYLLDETIHGIVRRPGVGNSGTYSMRPDGTTSTTAAIDLTPYAISSTARAHGTVLPNTYRLTFGGTFYISAPQP
jgi:hypothetical protein